jgi:hypothetical protein
MTRPRALALAVAAAALAAGAGASAQEGAAYRLRAVSPHPRGTVVAGALRVHAGSQDDPPGLEGTAWLLARVLAEQVNGALDPGRALFAASVERSTTVFTLLAEPGAWGAAWAAADSMLFRAALDPVLVERHRGALLAELAFEAGSPYREFEAGAAALLAEPGSAFARPPRGTSGSLAAVDAAGLEAYRSTFLLRAAAVQGLVGPLPAEPLPAPAPAGAAEDVAWLSGDRVSMVRDVTNAWIEVAYPAPSRLPRTHLELLAHLLGEELDPTPPQADRYDVDVRIEEAPRGPVLVVEASVVPEAAAAWEARILGALDALTRSEIEEDFFRWRRRRFRAERLLEESAPEVEAARLTADLLRDGKTRDLGVEIWGLSPHDLHAAARSLGPPRIFVLGPDLGPNGPGGR